MIGSRQLKQQGRPPVSAQTLTATPGEPRSRPSVDLSRPPQRPLSPMDRHPHPYASRTPSPLSKPVSPPEGPDVSTPLPALLTITRAAAILGLSRATAYRYAAAGELPTKRLGGRMYVVTAKLLPLINGTEEQAA